MSTKFVVERYRFSSYEEILRQTLQKCHDLQSRGGWISSVQIDTYLPYNRKELKNSLPTARSDDHWVMRLAATALQVAEQSTRETSVVTIWYKESHAKQGKLEHKLLVYTIYSHERIAEDVAKELDDIDASHGTLVALNYDTHGSHRSEHSDSAEKTAVSVFYSKNPRPDDAGPGRPEPRGRRGRRSRRRRNPSAGSQSISSERKISEGSAAFAPSR
jgi:hypothetical protein